MSSVPPPENGSVQTVPPISDDLVKAVRGGECILFLGAGVHYPPDDNDPNYGGCYPPAIRPPVGSELANIIYKDSDLKIDPNYGRKAKLAIARNLQRMSLYYEINKEGGRKELVRKVKQEIIPNKQPSRALKALALLDFPIICTTNYDNLFEKALILANKNPNVSSYSNQPTAITKDYVEKRTPPADNPFLFKIHSDIDDPTESIVITDEDYIQFILRMMTGGMYHPIPMVFRSHMLIWPMLFIGFSLMDYNLRLLFKLLGWNIPHPKHSYSVGPYPDGLIRKTYDPPVKFIVQDVWDFVPKLYRAVTGKPMP